MWLRVGREGGCGMRKVRGMRGRGIGRLAAVLCAALFVAAGTAEAQRPVLRVGIDYAGPDAGMIDATGIYHSIDTDYMQVLASYAGMDAVFVQGAT